ncbi:MAG: 16S rRNA (cytosine(1402)-N(4))-methyltransferase RsmH [Acidimicrobiia bacterium]
MSAPRGLAMGQATTEPRFHVPVMTTEVVELFRPISRGVIVDMTYGGGGHSAELLRELEDAVRILAIDRDPAAVAQAREGARLRAVQANYRELEETLAREGITATQGVFFDLGVSAFQLTSAERGFSFRKKGPLDMRMGPDAPHTADELVNEWPQDRLAEIIFRYGEERYSRRIARAILAARPITDTLELAEVIRSAVPPGARGSPQHPARRTFQAIRIAVNDELQALKLGLEAAIASLEVGGRCVVISYHSGEDRLTKQRFATGAAGCVCPPELPVCTCGKSIELILLTRKPLRPSPSEVTANPRARSARLRAVEKAA